MKLLYKYLLAYSKFYVVYFVLAMIIPSNDDNTFQKAAPPPLSFVTCTSNIDGCKKNPDDNYFIEITNLQPQNVQFGGTITITVKYNLPSIDNPKFYVFPENNPTGCYTAAQLTQALVGTSSDGQDLILNTSTFNQNCLNSPFKVHLTVGEYSSQDVAFGINEYSVSNYEIYTYYSATSSPIPNGWAPLETAFRDGNQTLIHNVNQDQNFPCENFTVNDVTGLRQYLLDKIPQFTSANQNKAFLIGLCYLNGYQSNQYGTSIPRIVSNYPTASIVFVSKLKDYMAAQNIEEQYRNKIITWFSIHELGHSRGLVHGSHSGNFEYKCAMQEALETGSLAIIDIPTMVNDPRFCNAHCNLLKFVSWH